MASKFTADFETTTLEDDCRVWAWASSEIGDVDNYECGNSIESFFDWLESLPNATEVYFHNLKFDGQFCCAFMEQNGFHWVSGNEEAENRTYTTLIGDTGAWYSITIFFEVIDKVSKKTGKKTRRYHRIIIKDSLKILNFSVDQIAKDFDLPISKLELDYKAFREKGHILSEQEQAYIANDVKIMSMALDITFKRGLTKSTAASNALHSFKTDFCKNFTQLFPVLDKVLDKELRTSYKGGFTYLNPKYKGATLYNGINVDCNSMYPYILHSSSGSLMPIGHPIPYEGKFIESKLYPLYIQRISCSFHLKPNKIPSIQLKNVLGFMPTQYIENSDEIVTLTLTKPDLELFFEQYDVEDLTWENGWLFQGKMGIFDDYVNYWIQEKIENKRKGNKALTLLAKLELNSLYGRFGSSTDNIVKRPYYDDINEVMRYINVNGEKERKPTYLPVAAFTTAYARSYIIRNSQLVRDWSMETKGYDAWIYNDTDSIHMRLDDEDLMILKQKGFNIDDYELGAWKIENTWRKGKYLHSKCYIEDIWDSKLNDYNINVTIAGLPKKLAQHINFDNFDFGFSTANLPNIKDKKLTYKTVKGGVILKEVEFTIK